MSLTPGDYAFATLAANPIGGLLVAIPFAMFELHYPAWLAVVAGTPLAYLQVIAVDALWTTLGRSALWRRLIERRRSPRVEALLASRGGFWVTFVASPLLGPWVVMAFMRYAQVPQRRVATPILLSILISSALLAGACALVPELVRRS